MNINLMNIGSKLGLSMTSIPSFIRLQGDEGDEPETRVLYVHTLSRSNGAHAMTVVTEAPMDLVSLLYSLLLEYDEFKYPDWLEDNETLPLGDYDVIEKVILRQDDELRALLGEYFTQAYEYVHSDDE